MSTLRGAHALAVSVLNPDNPDVAVIRALQALEVPVQHLRSTGGVLVTWQTGESAATVTTSVDLVAGQQVDPSAILATGDRKLPGLAGWTQSMLAPAARLVDESGSIEAAVDVCGIGDLYFSSGDTWSLVSSDPAVLAHATNANLDHDAIVIYSAMGHFLGESTAWMGVTRFGPGEVQSLHDGARHSRLVRRATSSTSSLAEAVVQVVSGQPNSAAELELSGGLDSRLLLAAARSAGRTPTVGFTMGAADSDDVRVARVLAAAVGIDHQIAKLETFGAASMSELNKHVLEAASARGWLANPVDAAVLQWAEAGRNRTSTLSGQNGELARGYYYRGPHAWAPPSRRAELLTKWRLTTNDRVSPSLLGIDGTDQEQRVTHAIRSWLDVDGRAGDFLRSTDEFYLRHRMTRWVGPAYAARGRRNGIVAPFFSAGWVQNAAELTIADRRHSRSVAQAVIDLDPQLATIELAGGPAPTQMVRSLSGATGRAATFGHKAFGKVRQKLRHSTTDPVGTPLVVAAIDSRRNELIDLVIDDPIVSRSALTELRSAATIPGRDLACLVLLAGWRRPRDQADLKTALI